MKQTKIKLSEESLKNLEEILNKNYLKMQLNIIFFYQMF